jgi:hypothetical protein
MVTLGRVREHQQSFKLARAIRILPWQRMFARCAYIVAVSDPAQATAVAQNIDGKFEPRARTRNEQAFRQPRTV